MPEPSKKSEHHLVVLSGGLDSTVLLYHVLERARRNDELVSAVSFHYGQRHARELQSAFEICDNLGVRQFTIDLDPIPFEGSSQTSDDIAVPHGHYAEESMKQTVVPNRNMVLLAMANALAQSCGMSSVWYGAHAGDHAIYPDCRADFVKAMSLAFSHSGWEPPTLQAPFISLTKADVVTLGAKLGIPFAKTWSCYEGGAEHCGKCGTCVERREAFQLAGVEDPTTYEG